MKDIFGTIMKYVGYGFSVLVIGYTATLTYMLAGRLVPDNIFLQVMTIILFDGAAFVWFGTFITNAKGTTQWAISGIGFFIGILGATIMAAGELVLGQNLVVFSDPSRLGWILIATVITACVTNVVFVYLYHFSSPEVKNRIEIQQKIAAKIERAHVDARERLDKETGALTAGIADSVIEAAKMLLEGEIGVNVKERNRRAVDNSKVSGAPPILAGVSRDPLPNYRPVAASATPGAAHNNWQKSNKKQQHPQRSRPSHVQEPAFGGNGHGPSAEHAAFAAASVAPDAIKEAERSRPPSPPPSGSNPRS